MKLHVDNVFNKFLIMEYDTKKKNYNKKIQKLLDNNTPKKIYDLYDNLVFYHFNFLKSEELKKIQNEKNKGKGSCIQEGIKNCRGDIAIIQDADPEYSPKDIEMLVAPFEDPETIFVVGTRFQTKYKRKIGYFYHTVFNKMITFLVNLRSNTNFTDIECGYKAFKI